VKGGLKLDGKTIAEIYLGTGRPLDILPDTVIAPNAIGNSVGLPLPQRRDLLIFKRGIRPREIVRVQVPWLGRLI
jgi:hypothetical protein